MEYRWRKECRGKQADCLLRPFVAQAQKLRRPDAQTQTDALIIALLLLVGRSWFLLVACLALPHGKRGPCPARRADLAPRTVETNPTNAVPKELERAAQTTSCLQSSLGKVPQCRAKEPSSPVISTHIACVEYDVAQLISAREYTCWTGMLREMVQISLFCCSSC
jgi:hypothetical protein